MSEVRAQIEIDAPPERVYDLMLDPERLHEWVTIHRKVNRTDSGEFACCQSRVSGANRD